MKLKNKKLFAILTLVAFMITLMPVMAFAASGDYKWKDTMVAPVNQVMYDAALMQEGIENFTQAEAENLAKQLAAFVKGQVEETEEQITAQIAKDVKAATGKDVNVTPDPGPGPAPSGDVSVSASIVATADESVSIEADGKSGSTFPETDINYAEVDVVLRQANNQAANGGTFYFWVEESGKSRQASDALVLNMGTKVAGDYNVYKIDATTNVTTMRAAFLRGGTYTVKASTVNPVDGANDGLLANVSTFKTETNKNTITVTAKSQVSRDFTIDVKTAKDTIHANLEDGQTTKDPVPVYADTVATTKVTLVVKNGSGNLMSTYPVKLSTNSSNIEVDKTSLTTDYKGEVSFNVAGIREGEYKLYVTIGDYEATIKVQVGATSANDIQLIKFPSNPIATDTDVDDYANIFRFQLTDANGNIVTGKSPKGAKYATMSSDADKNATETAKYATIVNAPTANKVKDADLTLDWVDGKDYYTLRVDNGKAFTAEGDYEVRVVLDNGKSATVNFTVKKFDTAVSLHIEYPTSSVELNSTTDIPDIYFLDASNVMKKANNRVTVAGQGYAIYSVTPNGKEAGKVTIKNDEKYVGQTVTITAISDKENLMASTTLTVADEAKEVKLASTRGQVNANNRVAFSVVDSTGNTVALGSDAVVEVSAVVANTGDKDAKVSYSVAASSRTDLQNSGTGTINLSSNKETTATVNIIVKVTKGNDNNNNDNSDGNTGLSTTYYSGTETYTFGAEASKSVVMTIGSKEIVANNVPVATDVAPFIKDNRTWVPFRALTEAFGAQVDYNAENNTVTAKLNGKTVVLTVGSTVLTVNDEAVTMDVAPYIVDDRVVVPVRFVAEAFGFTVEATQDEAGATASVVFYTK